MGSPFFVAAGRADCYTRGEQLVLGKKGADMKGHCRGQQGAILVLTAFLLPFIIAFTGMAVDFGNLYVQHQKLQNAADAAALAGAYNFKAENSSDMSVAKENADKAAVDNANTNCGGRMADANVNMDKPKVDNLQKPSYYGVRMTKPVPIYFLSYFPGIDNTQDVSAVATAKINPSAEKKTDSDALVDSLAIYSESFDSTKEIKSEGDNAVKTIIDNVNSTFDGKITYTNNNAKNDTKGLYYDGKKVFFTQKAKEDKQSTIADLMKKKQGEYWDTIHSGTFDYNENAITKAFTDKEKVFGKYDAPDNRVTLVKGTIDGWLDDPVIYIYRQDLTIDGNNLLSNEFGRTNEDIPVYVEVDNLTNINLESDTIRPIFIYAKRGNVNLNMNGHNFRGIIYAPTSSFIVNLNGSTFQGSVVAKRVSFHETGHYIYEGFNETGKANSSSSGSGSGGITQNQHDVSLVSNDKISWDEK